MSDPIDYSKDTIIINPSDKHTAGRYNQLPLVKDKIIAGISRGLSESLACASAGITPRAYTYWKKAAEGAPNAYKFKNISIEELQQFFIEIEIAKAEFAATLVDTVVTAAATDYKAAVFLLERLYTDDYGKKETVNHTFKNLTPEDLQSMTKEEIKQLLAENQ